MRAFFKRAVIFGYCWGVLPFGLVSACFRVFDLREA